MIEPIGSGDKTASPYERYSQYQQYRSPEAVQHGAAGAASGSALTPAPTAASAPPGRLDQPAQNRGSGPAGAPRQAGRAGDVAAAGDRECQTCKNRQYQDGSDDPGVSYKTPTRISADRAGSAVRAHEYEHVSRERAQARRENREVVSQSVAIKTAFCPECGVAYVSGGTTTTVTKAKSDESLARAAQPATQAGVFNRSV